jgi:DNA-binding NarL/FixJ family response regulator
MSTRALRAILLVGDGTNGDQIIQHLDGIRDELVTKHADSEPALVAMIPDMAPDVVLTDRPFSASESYRAIRMRRPEAALIMVADRLDEETVVTFLREGADDLVLGANLARLRRAVQDSLDARKHLSKLSPRQIEVLIRVADGNSTREIAEALGLSAKTVESHRGAMMKRLGIHDLASLVRYAVRMGLVRNGHS